MSETTPFQVGHQGNVAILCQMVEWFSLSMSLATSQESFLKIKGHLLKRPLHFPKHKGTPLWWYWDLSWAPHIFPMGQRPFQQHWICWLPRVGAELLTLQHRPAGESSLTLGSTPNWQLLGRQPEKKSVHMIPKVAILCLKSRGPQLTLPGEFSFSTLWMNVSLPHINYKLNI